MRLHGLAFLAAVLCAGPATAQDRTYIPERRAVLVPDVDFYGADLRSVFDTTREACQAACIAESACRAFTFNARSSSCFLKSAVSREEPYQGAVSGVIRQAEAGAAPRAALRAAELSFLTEADFDAAQAQAGALAAREMSGSATAEDLLRDAADARAADDLRGAARLTGAAANLLDTGEAWSDYADLLLAIPPQDDADRR